MNPAREDNLSTDVIPPKRATFGGRMAHRRGFQEGTLIKRGTKTKVWVGRWWESALGPKNEVKRKRRSEILGTIAELPTKREARQELNARLRKINSGEYRPQSVWTFERFVEDSWQPDLYPTLKYSGQKHYTYLYETHLKPVFGKMQLRHITREAAQSFLNQKFECGLSWSTVKHIRTALGTIVEAAFMQDLVDTNSIRKTRLPRRGARKERLPIEAQSVKQLIESLPYPSNCIATLLGFTGLRIGELLALRWQDVNLETKTLMVRQTVYEGHFDDPKSSSSRRQIPLGTQSVQLLLKICPDSHQRTGLIFKAGNGSPLSRRNLMNRQLKPTCKRIGLDGVNWHWFRHADASLLDSVGAPIGTVQKMLGHSTPTITRETYIHAIPSDAQKAVSDVENLIDPIGPKFRFSVLK